MAKKTKKVVNKKRNVEASTAAALATAVTTTENAHKTAQPGIIGGIIDLLASAKTAGKPMTTDEILAGLQKQFPDRAPAGMMTTIRAQLSRLPKEKNVQISKQRDGRVVRYAAA